MESPEQLIQDQSEFKIQANRIKLSTSAKLHILPLHIQLNYAILVS